MTETTIEALISPIGPHGGSAGGDAWKFSTRFVAWVEAGELKRGELLVGKAGLDHDALRHLMGLAPSLTAVRAVLEGPPEAMGEEGLFRATLVRIDGPSAHPTLLGIAEELRQPVRFEDPDFGAFTLDRRLGEYDGELTLGNQVASLHLSHADEREAREILGHARALQRDWDTWRAKLERQILDDLLELKNESWSDPGEQVTAEQFLRALTPSSVTIYDDGSFEAFYDDGQLFSGHLILVTGDVPAGRVSDAHLAG